MHRLMDIVTSQPHHQAFRSDYEDDQYSQAEPGTLLEFIDQLHGDRPAIINFFDDGDVAELSYDRLAADVRRVAAGLQDRGVEPGRPVAIWAPNCPDWVTAYLAAVAAGAVVLPLDEQLPAEEVRAAVSRLKPALLFTVAVRQDSVASCIPTVLLDAPETSSESFASFGSGSRWQRPPSQPRTPRRRKQIRSRRRSSRCRAASSPSR